MQKVWPYSKQPFSPTLPTSHFMFPTSAELEIRNQHHYAGRALSEALYHLRCPDLLPTFHQLARCADRLTQELSIYALADLRDTEGVRIALEHAENISWTKSRKDRSKFESLRKWMAGTGPSPTWTDDVRWRSQADRLVCRLTATSGLDLLQWEAEDLPLAAEYENRLESTAFSRELCPHVV